MSAEKMATRYLIQFRWKNPWGNEPGTGPPACWKNWILLGEFVKDEEEAIKKGKEQFNLKRIDLGYSWKSLLGFRVLKIIEEQKYVKPEYAKAYKELIRRNYRSASRNQLFNV